MDRLFEGSRTADGVEHEEVVEGAVEAGARRAYARLAQERGFEQALATPCADSVCLVMGSVRNGVTTQRPSRGGALASVKVPSADPPSQFAVPGDASGSAPFKLRQAVPEPLARAVE